MSMSEQTLQVSPTELIKWALAHERAADGCAAARSDNQRTAAAASIDSTGGMSDGGVSKASGS